jgi:hypothetical protein
MKQNIRTYDNLIGKNFGDLTFIKPTGYFAEYVGSHRVRPQGLVRCSCGAEFNVFINKLKRGNPKSCKGCCHRELKVGQRFDKVIVVGFVFDSTNNFRVKCLCDCGAEFLSRTGLLKNNITNSCGCSPNGQWKGYGRLSGINLYRIKRNAKVRNIPFSVTAVELWELFVKQRGMCALSGLPIEINIRGKNTASLDRIDSLMGYTLENVQWVHKDINLMKMDFSQDRFFELCKKVIQNQEGII